jgi:hypothetical protein
MTPNMSSGGQTPLKVFPVNGEYILAVYQGKLSEFDLLLKYRQRSATSKSGWSRIRTPKHIHWAVDVLIKMHSEKSKTQQFINFLIDYWQARVFPINSIKSRSDLLDGSLFSEVENEASNYKELACKGEYSVKFLLLIAKLLMFQEKTNFSEAYMFKSLLSALASGEDIFKIVSLATHTGK